MAFAVAKVTTRACWTGWLKVPPYPNMIAMTKSEPARLPQNVMNQCSSIFQGERRRCRAAIVVSCSSNTITCQFRGVSFLAARQPTMKLPVHKSVPVDKIATRPHGKIIADSKRTTPGAFSWNQGEAETKSCSSNTRLLSAIRTFLHSSHPKNSPCTRMRRPASNLR
jgi:hypothetical protein